ncbi:MAG TPA: hypothetical protein VGB04_14740 [Allosphingosinicella sp.]|jgi:hypothetical protein
MTGPSRNASSSRGRNGAALKSARRLAIAASAALALAGCGSEAPTQDEAGKVAKDLRAAAGGSEACPLLGAAEVSGLLGAEVEDAIKIGGGCAFNYAGTADNAANMESAPASAYGPGGAKPDEYQELPGIGDAAWIGRGYQKSWTAQARKGDRFVNINVGGKSGSREVAIAMLKAALAKI